MSGESCSYASENYQTPQSLLVEYQRHAISEMTAWYDLRPANPAELEAWLNSFPMYRADW